MQSTVNSLKDLYESLGGQLTDTFEDIAGGVPVADYTTIPDVIEACSQIAGSTIELPAVSGSDNGKVLKVIEGEWAKGTDESLPAVTADDNGKVLKVADGAWGVGTDESLPAVSASDNGKILKVANGAWGVDIADGLPAVTSSDNGKMLKVKSGAWNTSQVISKRTVTAQVATTATTLSFSSNDYSGNPLVGISITDPTTLAAFERKTVSITIEHVFISASTASPRVFH